MNRDPYDRLLYFITDHLGMKLRPFEELLGLTNSRLRKALEKKSVSSEILEQIFSLYPNLNPNWLFRGKGDMIIPAKQLNITIAQEAEVYYESSTQSLSIPIADMKAAAGSGYMNTEVLRTSEFIQLPNNLTKKGKHLCIRIKGNSMSPTLQDGGFVVIRLLEKPEWTHLISDRVYVVSDNEGQTFLKRVRNRFVNGFIVLTSDNPDKATYPNFNLQADEIISIWYVEWYLSAKMPNIHDQFYSKLERLENNIDDLNKKFDELTRIELKKKDL